MELKEFVKESLVEIIIGVIESQKYLKENSINAEINPKVSTRWESTTLVFSEQGKPIQYVDFDVAVTTNEKTGTKGTIGIVISSLGIGGQVSNELNNNNISKLKFSVPITLP